MGRLVLWLVTPCILPRSSSYLAHIQVPRHRPYKPKCSPKARHTAARRHPARNVSHLAIIYNPLESTHPRRCSPLNHKLPLPQPLASLRTKLHSAADGKPCYSRLAVSVRQSARRACASCAFAYIGSRFALSHLAYEPHIHLLRSYSTRPRILMRRFLSFATALPPSSPTHLILPPPSSLRHHPLRSRSNTFGLSPPPSVTSLTLSARSSMLSVATRVVRSLSPRAVVFANSSCACHAGGRRPPASMRMRAVPWRQA